MKPETNAMRPLQGVLVVDFSTLLPGPLATLLLAEAGAEVVKIERPPGGDDLRHYEPAWDGDSAVFALLNRGKKSIALDLKSTADRERLRPLLERADVIVEQFRPGVMARLGLGYEDVTAINARAIYCSITGYGHTGPKRDIAAHDLNLIAETGLLALSMGPVGDVVLPPTALADIVAGSYPAVINILLALQARAVSGRGRHLDIALSDGLFTLSYWALAHGWAGGGWPGERAGLLTGASPRYRVYATRDGKAIAAAPLEPKFWEAFCDAIGLEPALRQAAADPRATINRIAQIIASEDAAVWAQRFATRDCCCSVVADLRSAIDDPQFRSRGLFAHELLSPAGRRIPALPVPVDASFRSAPGTALAAPSLGRDDDML